MKYGDQTTARNRQAGRITSAYLVNFARTGDPNGAGLPRWPRYDRATDSLVDISAQGTAVPERDPWGGEIDAGVPRR